MTAPHIDEEEDDAVLRCISEAREMGWAAGVDEAAAAAAWEDSVSSSRTMRFIASSTSNQNQNKF